MISYRVPSMLAAAACLLLGACWNNPLRPPQQQPPPVDNSPRLITTEVVKYYLNPFGVDLDGDAVPEIFFQSEALQAHDVPSSSTNWSLSVQGRDGCLILCDASLDAHVLNAGDEFPWKTNANEPSPWQKWATLIHAGLSSSHRDTVWQGPWAGADHKFLGVSFSRANRMHFAWVQMSIDKVTGKLTIHDHAYHPEPDHSMRAGEK